MNEQKISPHTKHTRKLVFLCVGIFNTLLDFAFYTVLTQVFLTEQNSLALAGFISGTVALLCAFLTHRFITWRDRSVSRVTILKFFTFTGLGMWILRPVLLSVFIHFNSLYRAVHTITSNLHLPFSYDFVAKTGAFGFMVVLILIYNFLTYDRFVFHAKNKH